MMDFYLRIAGSALGTAAQRAMPLGASGPGALVAAGAGSKLVRKIFDEMPQIDTLGVMQEMMENPALLAAMLKKPKSETIEPLLERINKQEQPKKVVDDEIEDYL